MNKRSSVFRDSPWQKVQRILDRPIIKPSPVTLSFPPPELSEVTVPNKKKKDRPLEIQCQLQFQYQYVIGFQ
ncbi:hypothetical protein Cni_G02293 [Canna indica]|uniref:Uncharacterized protein n=1 Tax=Canna indica TaxID=4628 RepID=A0AAQ3PZX8_9LILI|nr:hypothetical protein Cni_G02293 [Canna indica]